MSACEFLNYCYAGNIEGAKVMNDKEDSKYIIYYILNTCASGNLKLVTLLVK
jgi:hypothetical protein